jgi:hypothetical protein
MRATSNGEEVVERQEDDGAQLLRKNNIKTEHESLDRLSGSILSPL